MGESWSFGNNAGLLLLRYGRSLGFLGFFFEHEKSHVEGKCCLEFSDRTIRSTKKNVISAVWLTTKM